MDTENLDIKGVSLTVSGNTHSRLSKVEQNLNADMVQGIKYEDDRIIHLQNSDEGMFIAERKTIIEPSEIKSIRSSNVTLSKKGKSIRKTLIIMIVILSVLLMSFIWVGEIVLLTLTVLLLTIDVIIASRLYPSGSQISLTDGENTYVFQGEEDDIKHIERAILANL